ncbi:MAG: response regulator transcription factor [SAR324 cluster bacterium]|nr:response regulator transcription factor [SAR324 cluster bacterium]
MIKILYVDANMKRGMELKELLPSSNYSIDVAFTGWEGLGAAMLYHPDIMLLDLLVPVMDGLELLRLLRTEEKHADLPVLGFTTPRNEDFEKQALKMACAGIFEYPFDVAELSQLIQQTMSSVEEKKASDEPKDLPTPDK